METKIFRLSLQLQGCQSELKESREESARLNRLKEQRQDMFCEQNMRWAQKQAKYFNEIVDVNDRMQELKKHTSVRTSELERETQLRDRKIQHLESKIREYEIQRDLKVIQIEGRYRQKIGYLQRDHIELMRKHEEQLRQMKAIYKIDDEEKGQMNVSNGKHRIDNEIYT